MRRLDEKTFVTDEVMVWRGHRLREAVRRTSDIGVVTFCGIVGSIGFVKDEVDAREVTGPVTCRNCQRLYAKISKRAPS